ncbi:hypothetical protein H310_01157 [Aphanomyces invadans]|uniref:Uncharacterized protein n=1 Tax=Aphanomyces invadans TaxID=157072 RepID=A0A024UQ94_9STRA|nr:hypothetical protein H310_01157 [Aphanomyces invadans]ETW08616.1 hypothetical protein H310_01157 [Aphanomyces invadans]|eukprot:XP_008862421.1 hypothetical protein H310_01157 [Aphanomyces invadans]
MDAEEVLTRSAVALEQRRQVETTLALWSSELRSTQRRLEMMADVFMSVHQRHLDKQRTWLASQVILTVDIEEDASQSPKLYSLSIGHGLMWVYTFPYAPSVEYLEPTTRQHKPSAHLVLATWTKVAMFARPVQVDLSIQRTHDDGIWKVEVYARAIGIVVTYHVDVSHVLEEHTFHPRHISREVARARALAWLCGTTSDLAHPDSLWATCIEHMNLPSWRCICQVMTKVHSLLQSPDDLLGCSGLVSREQRGVVRFTVLDHAFSALQDGIQSALDEIEQCNQSQIRHYHSILCGPFAQAVVQIRAVDAPPHPATPLPPVLRLAFQLVIPVELGNAPEEVFIQEPVDFAVLSRLLGSTDLDLLDALHGHVVAIANPSTDSEPNVRASGLTRSVVYGPALYLCHSSHVLDRLMHIDPTRSSGKRQAQPKGAMWRTYANDRMRAARQAKPSHAHLPLESCHPNDDNRPPRAATWHPSSAVQTMFVATLSNKELEYMNGLVADVPSLPRRAVDVFLQFLDFSTMTWGALDTKVVFSGKLDVAVVDGDPVTMTLTISVNNLTAPTSLMVSARDASNRFGTTAFHVSIPWEPVETRPRHASAWVTFAHDCVSRLVLLRMNGQVDLRLRHMVPLVRRLDLMATRDVAAPGNILQYAALRNHVPGNAMSMHMGSARLNKHLRSSVLDRMRKRFAAVQLASAKAAVEWPHMVEEDAFSAEFRGILTLPLKQLHKLYKAFDAGTQQSQAGAANVRRAVLSALGSTTLRIEGEKEGASWATFHSFAEWWRVADIERRRREPPSSPVQPYATVEAPAHESNT